MKSLLRSKKFIVVMFMALFMLGAGTVFLLTPVEAKLVEHVFNLGINFGYDDIYYDYDLYYADGSPTSIGALLGYYDGWVPTRDGYSLMGWQVTYNGGSISNGALWFDDCGYPTTAWHDNFENKLMSAPVVTAVWEKDTYTLTYIIDDVVVGMQEVDRYSHPSFCAVGYPDVPFDQYFIGWVTSNGTVVFDENLNYTGVLSTARDYNLYASFDYLPWHEMYCYDSYNGSEIYYNEVMAGNYWYNNIASVEEWILDYIAAQEATWTDTYETGMIFDGFYDSNGEKWYDSEYNWCYDPDGDGNYEEHRVATENIDLYARYKYEVKTYYYTEDSYCQHYNYEYTTTPGQFEAWWHYCDTSKMVAEDYNYMIEQSSVPVDASVWDIEYGNPTSYTNVPYHIFDGWYDYNDVQWFNAEGVWTGESPYCYEDMSGPVTLYPRYMLDIWTDYRSAPTNGDGTSSNPYEIASAENLAWLAYQVNIEGESFEGQYFKQTANINLSGHLWFAIGTEANPFKGNYTGEYLVNNFCESTFSDTVGSCTVTSCDCNTFGVVKNADGTTTGITKHTTNAYLSPTYTYFGYLAKNYDTFLSNFLDDSGEYVTTQVSYKTTITNSNGVSQEVDNPIYTNYTTNFIGSSDSNYYAGQLRPMLYKAQKTCSITNGASAVLNQAIIGLNKDFAITFKNSSGAKNINLDSTRTNIAKLFGYSSWATFKTYAQNIVDKYTASSLTSWYQFDGAIYRDGYYVLPYKFDGNSNDVIALVFVKKSTGVMSIWVDNVDNINSVSNNTSINVYGRHQLYGTSESRKHSIQNITTVTAKHSGLFGKVEGSTLNMLNFFGTNSITSSQYAGMIAGEMRGVVANIQPSNSCQISVDVSSSDDSIELYAGGYFGKYTTSSSLSINDYYFSQITINVSAGYRAYAGGVSGYMDGTGAISCRLPKIKINALSLYSNDNFHDSLLYAGGLFGFLKVANNTVSGEVASELSISAIAPRGYVNAGGYVGYLESISTTMAVSNVTGMTVTATSGDADVPNGYAYAGGVIGRSQGSVTLKPRVYSTSTIQAEIVARGAIKATAAGLIAYASGSVNVSNLIIKNSKIISEQHYHWGTDAYAGGLIGVGSALAVENVSIDNVEISAHAVGYYGGEDHTTPRAGGLIAYADGNVTIKKTSVTTLSIDVLSGTDANKCFASVGGLVGEQSAGTLEVEESIHISGFTVDASADGLYLGGVVGKIASTCSGVSLKKILISDTDWINNSGEGYVGGFVGRNEMTASGGFNQLKIDTCYYEGSLADGTYVAGFVGDGNALAYDTMVITSKSGVKAVRGGTNNIVKGEGWLFENTADNQKNMYADVGNWSGWAVINGKPLQKALFHIANAEPSTNSTELGALGYIGFVYGS